jgi:hypothetical protein
MKGQLRKIGPFALNFMATALLAMDTAFRLSWEGWQGVFFLSLLLMSVGVRISAWAWHLRRTICDSSERSRSLATRISAYGSYVLSIFALGVSGALDFLGSDATDTFVLLGYPATAAISFWGIWGAVRRLVGETPMVGAEFLAMRHDIRMSSFVDFMALWGGLSAISWFCDFDAIPTGMRILFGSFILSSSLIMPFSGRILHREMRDRAREEELGKWKQYIEPRIFFSLVVFPSALLLRFVPWSLQEGVFGTVLSTVGTVLLLAASLSVALLAIAEHLLRDVDFGFG